MHKSFNNVFIKDNDNYYIDSRDAALSSEITQVSTDAEIANAMTTLNFIDTSVGLYRSSASYDHTQFFDNKYGTVINDLDEFKTDMFNSGYVFDTSVSAMVSNSCFVNNITKTKRYAQQRETRPPPHTGDNHPHRHLILVDGVVRD
jgi:hypothetical protein